MSGLLRGGVGVGRGIGLGARGVGRGGRGGFDGRAFGEEAVALDSVKLRGAMDVWEDWEHVEEVQ